MTTIITKYAFAFVLCLITMMLLDAIWLGFVARDFYGKAIGHLMAEQPNFVAALIFYLLYIIGIFIFSIYPAAQHHSRKRAAILGALFGFMGYMTYDLTNLAIMRDWPISIVFVDVAWGVVITSIVAIVGFQVVKKNRNCSA